MNSCWVTQQQKQRTAYFDNWNLKLEDSSRSGRPTEIDLDILKELIESDPQLTTRCVAEQLGCSHTTVETHLELVDV
ncbi:unnamed protein product [Adineta ricciae]|uniref:Transposase n=1 Tax=Adineta ricciae TaxID=249248 RepID=A0A816HWH7_ADIRI|nr:unnamed protein product [Adineta ricciae]